MAVPIEIINTYFPDIGDYEISPFGNGHIQTTYRLIVNNKEYILQKINTEVFPDVNILISNHINVCGELSGITKYIIPQLIPNKKNEFLVLFNNEYWRMMEFIPNSYSLEKTGTPENAFEAAKAYAWFVSALADAEISLFKESIIDFHSLSYRMQQFEEAITNDKASRKTKVISDVDFFLQRKNKLMELDKMIKNGEIPKRIVHNDTKINNVLFSNDKAIAVIDLDTCGPGTIIYDYGDALRTIGNISEEDEEDLKKVEFSLTNFRAFSDGYMSEVKNLLTPMEKKYLFLAPKFMTYIIGIRFLTDYLNGDIYYKVKKDDHNLIRSRVQSGLIVSMEEQEQQIISYLSTIFQ